MMTQLERVLLGKAQDVFLYPRVCLFFFVPNFARALALIIRMFVANGLKGQFAAACYVSSFAYFLLDAFKVRVVIRLPSFKHGCKFNTGALFTNFLDKHFMELAIQAHLFGNRCLRAVAHRFISLRSCTLCSLTSTFHFVVVSITRSFGISSFRSSLGTIAQQSQ